MKTKQKFWTDYPFVKLGDTPGKSAPLREVEIVDYDGDKYVTCSVIGTQTNYEVIKRFYVYSVKRKVYDTGRFRSKLLSSTQASYISEKIERAKEETLRRLGHE